MIGVRGEFHGRRAGTPILSPAALGSSIDPGEPHLQPEVLVVENYNQFQTLFFQSGISEGKIGIVHSVFRNAALKTEIRHLPFQFISQKSEQANELLIGLLQVSRLQKSTVCFQKSRIEVHRNISFHTVSSLSSIPYPAAKENSCQRRFCRLRKSSSMASFQCSSKGALHRTAATAWPTTS